MLVRDPRRRATASELLAHEWMRENGVAQDVAHDLQPEILARMKRFAGLNRLKKEALRVGSRCWTEGRQRMGVHAWGCMSLRGCRHMRACAAACAQATQAAAACAYTGDCHQPAPRGD